MHATPRTARRGFTLVELLVVIAIIGLISAVALPVVLPALNERRVSEAARLLQAVLAGARDAAIRANAPRGLRLLADPVFNGQGQNPLASNRVIPIEPAPDYAEGLVTLQNYPVPVVNPKFNILRINELLFTDANNTIPSNPTSWYWNLRQGDKIRFNGSGNFYTIAGPMMVGPGSGVNTDRFINLGLPRPQSPRPAEYLIVTNGLDDDSDGFTDESFDGLDNDGDFIVDPGFNGLDDDNNGIVDDEYTIGEFESEQFVGSDFSLFPSATPQPLTYTIVRRPVVSPGAREVVMPAGVVIDMTTWNAPSSALRNPGTGPTLQPERSRLPVDPYTYYVDIMVSPSGQVVQGGAGGSNGSYNTLSPSSSQPFYHFWLTEREGVVSPLWGFYPAFKVNPNQQDSISNIPQMNPNYTGPNTPINLLPMPQGTPNYPTNAPFLTGGRRLVTLFVKTGQIVSNSVESFDGYDTNRPFYDAQSGTKESQ